MGNSISRPPAQQAARPAVPTAQNGIGTTSVSEPPAPYTTGPIPGSVGAGQISNPPSPQPAPEPGTRGLGSSQIASPPQQQSHENADD